jgi:MipA family protein
MRSASLSLVALAVSAGAVSAQDMTPTASNPSLHGSYGVGTVGRPRYAGSNEWRAQPFPWVALEYKGRVFAGMQGIGAHVLRGPTTAMQLLVIPSESRPEHRGPALAGMGDRKASASIGTNASITKGFLSASGNVAYGLNGDEGTRGTIGLEARRGWSQRWMTSVSTGAAFSDARNMSYEFGVTEKQAAARRALIASGDRRLPSTAGAAYDPDAGLKAVVSTLTVGYMATQRTNVMLVAQGNRLSSEAAASSIVKERNGGMVALIVARGF